MIPPLDEIEVEKIHSRSKGRKRDEREVNVDMNPMVDLAFLLLTFFMLATTFSRPQAMELLVPAKAKDEAIEKEMPVKESKTLSLVLLENKIIWYNGITDPETKELNYHTEELKRLLKRQQASIDGLVVFIKPDSSNDFGELVEVLDMMKLNNVQRYALAPLSDFDKNLVQKEISISDD